MNSCGCAAGPWSSPPPGSLTACASATASGTFSRELWNACAEFGLQGILVPGSVGRRRRRPAVGRRRSSRGLATAVATTGSCSPLSRMPRPAKSRWRRSAPTRSAASGCRASPTGSLIGATGITEPDSGSSALTLATTAVQDGDEWVLNGSKTFVTNAPVADLFVIYARTGQGFGGISCFLRPARYRRAGHRPPIEKMGLRTSPMAQIYLDDCRAALLEPGGQRSARAR